MLLGTSSSGESNRKRKGDWIQPTNGDFEDNLEAPMAKVMPPKDRDRRKSQGEFFGEITDIFCVQNGRGNELVDRWSQNLQGVDKCFFKKTLKRQFST